MGRYHRPDEAVDLIEDALLQKVQRVQVAQVAHDVCTHIRNYSPAITSRVMQGRRQHCSGTNFFSNDQRHDSRWWVAVILSRHWQAEVGIKQQSLHPAHSRPVRRCPLDRGPPG